MAEMLDFLKSTGLRTRIQNQWPDWFLRQRESASEHCRRIVFDPQRSDGSRALNWDWMKKNQYEEASPEALEPLNFAAVHELSLIKPYLPYLVFINGFFSESLSHAKQIPRGVIAGSLAENLINHDPMIKTLWDQPPPEPADDGLFERLNFARFADGLFLWIPDKVVIDVPIQVLFVHINKDKRPIAIQPRILIAAGASCRLQLVLHEAGMGSHPYFSNGVCELFLGPGACVDITHVQRHHDRGIGFWHSHYQLKRHSSIEFLHYADSGWILRHNQLIDFFDEHAFASLRGLSILSGNTQCQNLIQARHRAGHCISRQHYKNILFDQTLSEFNSLVEVHENAVKSDSRQLNRNLLISDRAKAISKPKLKINADDVCCVHGASTGPLEPSELFYLCSRGLSPQMARAILTCGFAQEILDEIQDKTLNYRLQEYAEHKINRMLRDASANDAKQSV